MRRLRQTFPVVVLAALGCGNPTEPAWQDLLGHWTAAPEDLGPSGWYQVHLQLSPRGTMTYHVRMHGGYGQPREELTSFSRITGTYRVNGDRLIINPQQHTWWDSFYGPNSPEHTEPYTYGRLFDDAHYTLDSGRLTIHYLSYPLDAPVSTSVVFTR
jgi:hypothetical protein